MKLLLITISLFFVFGLFKACELLFKKKKVSLYEMGEESPESQSVIKNA